jgi:hypothetical protein
LAYWLVDGKIEPDERMQIPRILAARNAALNWVFLPRDARRGRLPERANLSATERALVTPSEFDAIYCASGISQGSLHCLDPESQVLTTVRALVCVEAPQYYEGSEVASELKRVLVLPSTGEFVHPGEYERLQVLREERRRQAEERRKAQQAAERRRAEREAAAQAAAARAAAPIRPAEPPPTDRGPAPARNVDFLAARASWLTPPKTPAAIEEPEGTCTLCGRRTRDWVVFDTKTGECKCRECLRNQPQRCNDSGER